MKKQRVKRRTVVAGANSSLGKLIRHVREHNGWTLRELSGKVAIPESTLTKVETGRLSPTYDRLQHFASRLGMTMVELLAPADAPMGRPMRPNPARRSLTGVGNRLRVSTPGCDYEYLCVELRGKRMVPIVTCIRAHDIAAAAGPVRRADSSGARWSLPEPERHH